MFGERHGVSRLRVLAIALAIVFLAGCHKDTIPAARPSSVTESHYNGS